MFGGTYQTFASPPKIRSTNPCRDTASGTPPLARALDLVCYNTSTAATMGLHSAGSGPKTQPPEPVEQSPENLSRSEKEKSQKTNEDSMTAHIEHHVTPPHSYMNHPLPPPLPPPTPKYQHHYPPVRQVTFYPTDHFIQQPSEIGPQHRSLTAPSSPPR